MKSGRCCKFYGKVSTYTFRVSIPLKSGRCCKLKTQVMKVVKSLNPFEVREVLQGLPMQMDLERYVSIPLKSGRCCKLKKQTYRRPKRLNPFEVREVLQDQVVDTESGPIGLNPFEVREVLQVMVWPAHGGKGVSIPLKSGRCCKLDSMDKQINSRSQSL